MIRTKTTALLAAASLIPLVATTQGGVVEAATLDVTAGDVDSLRDAVTHAGDGDVVVIPAGTYELACPIGPEDFNLSGDLDIREDLTLAGPATGTATIRPAAGCNERVIDVVNGASATLRDLTITGGREVLDFRAGGGIRNGLGSLALERTVVTGNSSGPSGNGGGIESFGNLSVTNSQILNNRTGDSGAGDTGSGGGIHVDSQRIVTITGSTISGNSLGTGFNGQPGWKAGGGGLAVRGFGSTAGTVSITDTTISDNRGGIAALGGGGGAWIEAVDVTLNDVDVLDNTIPGASASASGQGAGIAIHPRLDTELDVRINSGSFLRNTIGTPDTAATSFGANGGDGGALYIGSTLSSGASGDVSIVGTTFDANESGGGGPGAPGSNPGSGGDGGNLYVALRDTSGTGPTSSVTLTNVVLTNGVAGSSPARIGGAGGGAFVQVNVTGAAGASSTIDIDGATVTGNEAGAGGSGGQGGGIFVRSDTGATGVSITDSTFTGNQGGDGQALAEGGNGGGGGGAQVVANQADAPVNILDTTFRDNRAGNGGTGTSVQGGFGGDGGGASITADTITLDDATFDSNTAGQGGNGVTGTFTAGDGGGLHASGSAELAISGATFISNRSGSGGTASSGPGGTAGDGGAVKAFISGTMSVTGTTFDGNATGTGGTGTTFGGSGGPGGAAMVELSPGAGLVVSGTDITNNSAGDGGQGGTNNGGQGGPGGGLFVRGSASSVGLELARIEGNSTGDGGDGFRGGSAGSGGGVWVDSDGTGGQFSMIESSVADNRTGDGGNSSGAGQFAGRGGDGGGLDLTVGDTPAETGTITIDTTSVVNNTTGAGGTGGAGANGGVGGNGGGVEARTGGQGTLFVETSTIHGNVTGTGGPGNNQGDGGGLYVRYGTGTADLHASTVTGNDGFNGDNLLLEYIDVGSGQITLDTLVERTVIGDAIGIGNNSGENCRAVGPLTITSLGHNVEDVSSSPSTCNFLAPTDSRATGSGLGELTDNGGLGLTRMPFLGSPTTPPSVLDRVVPCATGSTDQRGVARPQGAGCDVGAVEAMPSVEAVDDVVAVDGFETTFDLVGNDELTDADPRELVVRITRQPDDGSLSRRTDGTWRYNAFQETGGFTDFDYQVCVGPTRDFCDTATATLVPASASRFVSLPPERVFDSRADQPAPGPKGFIGADQTVDVQITGVGGVPATGVRAVALNVTAVRAAGRGFVTAYAAGRSRPPTSNLNVATAGQTIPNFVIVPVGAGGKVTFYARSGAHLLADVAGYFTDDGVVIAPVPVAGAGAGRLVPLPPTRLFDTREQESAPGPKGFVGADETITVQVTGNAGVPAGAAAVVMNLTATNAASRGFITAYPADVNRPLASNINLPGPRSTAPNLAIIPLSADGRVSFYANRGAHLLGDVTGYITGDSAPRSFSGLFVPVEPDRLFDTRPGEPAPGPKGVIPADASIDTQITGVGGIPNEGASAVILNVTAARALARGFITGYPAGQPRPTASTINVGGVGETRPNAAALPLGANGQISFYANRGSQLLADAFGWFLE